MMFLDISWLFVRALFKAVGVWFADFNLYSGSRAEEKEKVRNVLRNNLSSQSLVTNKK